MEDIITRLKDILESEASLVVENVSVLSQEDDIGKTIQDDRFKKIKDLVAQFENKDDNFYSELIKVFSDYIDKLFARRADSLNVILNDSNGKQSNLQFDRFNNYIAYKMKSANEEFGKKLFDYVCDMLQEHPDITLDADTLKKLLNRNPQVFTYSIDRECYYRSLDFQRLANILKSNGTLKKSGMNVSQVYQLLIDTFQLTDENVFITLVTPKQFNEDHTALDDFLKICTARTFISVTNIIIKYYDEDFDRFSLLKGRKEKNFFESIIIEALKNLNDNHKNIDLILQVIEDENIQINYGFCWATYAGESELRSEIVSTEDRRLLKAIFKSEEDIEAYYSSGYARLIITELYADLGEYDKAFEQFFKHYRRDQDFLDFDDDFERVGFARSKASWMYQDSIETFIHALVRAFSYDQIEYSKAKAMIDKLLSYEEIKYINLYQTLCHLIEFFKEEDMLSILNRLLEKNRAGEIKFISAQDERSENYKVRIASSDEIKNDVMHIREAIEDKKKYRMSPK